QGLNKAVGRIKRAFRWGVRHKLVPATVLEDEVMAGQRIEGQGLADQRSQPVASQTEVDGTPRRTARRRCKASGSKDGSARSCPWQKAQTDRPDCLKSLVLLDGLDPVPLPR